ncbi:MULTISPECIES: helix-turn-helix transcriptional regulator [unclassified Streptomyces]|uniref:helix-turn-helix domain-containing protein n=1 Tax=unclassified Streptomyces TaxID=2593676 RepID=UPI00131A2FDB|nr:MULTISPECIES: helix-turn-helix transcriptional regulator [unclassified Streptomyces]MYX39081.1 helix-turn-helix domain-containing protein [Streptomyces sp. SID8377]
MEQSPDWTARVSRTIAHEVRRHRTGRGMSAQQLADACEALGAPMPRTVISNLENGRRGSITVAEVMVLAAALDVPPATLVFPVGHVDEVEYLPGQSVPPLAAVEWWHGLLAPASSPLALLRRHRDLEVRIRNLYRGIWEQAIAEYQWHGEPDGPEAEAARDVARDLTTQLHELRDEIARRGLRLPALAGLDKVTPLPPGGDRALAR